MRSKSGRRPLFGVPHHRKDSISLGHLINEIKAPSLYGSNIEAKSISKWLLVCTQLTTGLGSNDYSFRLRTNSSSYMKPLLNRAQTTITATLPPLLLLHTPSDCQATPSREDRSGLHDNTSPKWYANPSPYREYSSYPAERKVPFSWRKKRLHVVVFFYLCT